MKTKTRRTPERRSDGSVRSSDKGSKLMAFINNASSNISLVFGLSVMQTISIYFVIMGSKHDGCFGIFSHASMTQMIFISQYIKMCSNLVLLQISWVNLKLSLVNSQLLPVGNILILFYCLYWIPYPFSQLVLTPKRVHGMGMRVSSSERQILCIMSTQGHYPMVIHGYTNTFRK